MPLRITRQSAVEVQTAKLLKARFHRLARQRGGRDSEARCFFLQSAVDGFGQRQMEVPGLDGRDYGTFHASHHMAAGFTFGSIQIPFIPYR